MDQRWKMKRMMNRRMSRTDGLRSLFVPDEEPDEELPDEESDKEVESSTSEDTSADSIDSEDKQEENDFDADAIKFVNMVDNSQIKEEDEDKEEKEEEDTFPNEEEDAEQAEQRKISLRNQPMLNESLKMLTRSLTVYTVSLLRLYSSNGKSSVPFDGLTLESDGFSLVDVINGRAHEIPAFSRQGGSGRDPLDILDALLHTFSVMGLPVKKSHLDARDSMSSTATAEPEPIEEEDDEFNEICADAATLNLFFRTSLKKAPKACPDTCKHHRGTLCQTMDLHYVQLFFDQICGLSLKEDKFKKFRMSMAMDGTKMLRQSGNGRRMGAVDLSAQRSSLHNYDRRLIFSPELMKPDSTVTRLGKTLDEDPVRIVWMNDRVAGECVYFILCSKYSRRVTVVFRGTVTLKDWFQNLRNQRRKRPNPIKEDYPGKLDYIEALNGHSEYLLTRRRDTGRNKYDEIADKVFEYGMEMGEDFQVCVTGHSMGGALSTLFAFYATTDTRFKNQHPIRLYTFNSCFPGRVSFAKAFQHQEKTGKMMHIRFASKGDCIPHLKCLNDANDFAHTGVYVQVDDPLECKYTHDLSFWESFWVNFRGFSLFQFFWMLLHPGTAMESHALEFNMAWLWSGADVLAKSDPVAASMTMEQIYEKHVLDLKKEN